MNIRDDLRFYSGKRVLVTGHTGFKGSWLCRLLTGAGAEVTGYALEPESPSLFAEAHIGDRMNSVIGDIRDREKLLSVFCETRPEIVFHLAAQPLVRESYKNPAYTYETNVMGTVNVLECIRQSFRLNESVKSFLNVTTDKVYLNREWEWGYRENEELNGYDPYSNSKSCSELVTETYKRCFLSTIGISTARAGNVIGGGDFAKDRIIPDCIRAAVNGRSIGIRNPYSVRPFQHVLEPIFAYVVIARRQFDDTGLSGSYNIGPQDDGCVSAGTLAELFCKHWGGITWENLSESGSPHEAGFLKLDCSRIKKTFGVSPVWSIEKAVEMVCRFTKAQLDGGDAECEMNAEISEYMEDMTK